MQHFTFMRTTDYEHRVVKNIQIIFGSTKQLEIDRDTLECDGLITLSTYTIANIQDIGHLIATTFKTATELNVFLSDDVISLFQPELWVKWLSFGLSLSVYNYKHNNSPQLVPTLALFALNSSSLSLLSAFAQGQSLAKSQLISRELMNKPGNILYPESFVHAVEDLAIKNISISSLSGEDMLTQGFGGLMGIAQGSDKDARLLCLDYYPEKVQSTVVLVGKGVTFDSGGISIKQPRYMSTMKVDMGGAAAVVGALNAIAEQNLPIRVVGLCGLVENMPSGNAVKPGDVVTMLSKTSVEIITTDAEGRMVLADVLHYAQDTYHPDYLIDIATLTGATGIALGKEYASLMGNDDSLLSIAKEAGKSCAEAVWQMPTGGLYETTLKSDFADLRHGSEEPDGSACVAATFLEHFIAPTQKWIHIDSASMSLGMTHRHIHPSATSGFGVLLLSQICQHIAQQ
jgi:leucyl aminopeptidase